METRIIEQSGKLASPGKVTTITIPLPENVDPLKGTLHGRCECGGELIPSKKEKFLFVCNRDKWWNFWNRKHVKVKVNFEVLPESKGNA